MNPRVLAAIAATGAALALAVIAVAMPSPVQRSTATKPFIVSGTVRGLYPGASRPLRLRVRNPHSFPIRVVSLTAHAADASSRCRASNLVVSRLGRPLKVAAKSARSVVLRATLLQSAPLACRGASFRLAYRGRAVRR